MYKLKRVFSSKSLKNKIVENDVTPPLPPIKRSVSTTPANSSIFQTFTPLDTLAPPVIPLPQFDSLDSSSPDSTISKTSKSSDLRRSRSLTGLINFLHLEEDQEQPWRSSEAWHSALARQNSRPVSPNQNCRQRGSWRREAGWRSHGRGGFFGAGISPKKHMKNLQISLSSPSITPSSSLATVSSTSRPSLHIFQVDDEDVFTDVDFDHSIELGLQLYNAKPMLHSARPLQPARPGFGSTRARGLRKASEAPTISSFASSDSSFSSASDIGMDLLPLTPSTVPRLRTSASCTDLRQSAISWGERRPSLPVAHTQPLMLSGKPPTSFTQRSAKLMRPPARPLPLPDCGQSKQHSSLMRQPPLPTRPQFDEEYLDPEIVLTPTSAFFFGPNPKWTSVPDKTRHEDAHRGTTPEEIKSTGLLVAKPAILRTPSPAREKLYSGGWI
ncbi:hypothetical protein M231_02606 [Tremella mesenterica]|uniref:Uncharacterized protein n=1 Tax=Tremella mesenterica TaxID=5217 RepID=A0A4Q1BQD7_TREME|nr:uncharacterized protein TREMEDRAFT_73550 [Tremella mesenterica DSM 1558]EIW70742.1 hypothetical protein TREMEDRAFT_73550 [Tremella mesenterica DSM 1558]RXK40148.1 hypothetical protein M231_02606 [Tremella mesenterica]